MIKLSEPPRPRAESIVPMINVAFLLLIFFLMTAVIAPMDPVEIDLPGAVGASDAEGEISLYVEADGTFWRDGARTVALGSLVDFDVALHVARDLDGTVLARVLQDVKQAGADTVSLVVSPQ